MALWDESRISSIHTDIRNLRTLISKIDAELDESFVGSTGTVDKVESKLKIKNHNFYINNLDDSNAGGQGAIDREMDGLKNIGSYAKNW